MVLRGSKLFFALMCDSRTGDIEELGLSLKEGQCFQPQLGLLSPPFLAKSNHPMSVSHDPALCVHCSNNVWPETGNVCRKCGTWQPNVGWNEMKFYWENDWSVCVGVFKFTLKNYGCTTETFAARVPLSMQLEHQNASAAVSTILCNSKICLYSVLLCTCSSCGTSWSTRTALSGTPPSTATMTSFPSTTCGTCGSSLKVRITSRQAWQKTLGLVPGWTFS